MLQSFIFLLFLKIPNKAALIYIFFLQFLLSDGLMHQKLLKKKNPLKRHIQSVIVAQLHCACNLTEWNA